MKPTVVARVLALAQEDPNRTCFLAPMPLLDGSLPHFRRLSRAAFARCVRSLAARLAESGVRPGERVLWCLPNGLEWAALDLACQLAGATSVVVHPSTTVDALDRILAEVEPGMAFCAPGGGALSRGPLRLDEVAGLVASAAWSDRHAAPPSAAHRAPADARDPATVMYTSGSTGTPKGAMLSHAGLFTNAVATAEALGLGCGDVVPAVLSFSHSAGRTALLHTALVAGATVALLDAIDTNVDPAALAAVSPTLLVTVPRVLMKLVRQAAFAEAGEVLDPVAGLKSVLVGGASLPLPVADALEARGIRVYEAYGATEATCTVTINCDGRNRPGSVGRPLPGVELRIAPDGEVLCRGDCVTSGLWGAEGPDSEILAPGGWLRTGDLGRIDGDGYLWLTGRKKDVFLGADGNHFAPARIEALLESLPWVSEAVVVGDGRAFVGAIVAPQPEALSKALSMVHSACPRHPICRRSPEDMASCRRIARQCQADVDESVNASLPAFEAVRRLALLSDAFPPGVRSITRTGKVTVDRQAVERHFGEHIRDLYADPATHLAAARAAFRERPQRLLAQVAAFHESWNSGFEGASGSERAGATPEDRFPLYPRPSEEILASFESAVADGARRFSDRGYVGHMVSALPTIGVAAEALMAVLNQNQVSADASPTTTSLERTTVRWLADLVGYDPASAAGLGAAGGSIANITALLSARNRAFPAARQCGLRNGERGAILVSRRMHYSIRRAAEILGLGATAGVSAIAVDAAGRLDVDSLQRELDRIDSEGITAVAIVGIAGTSETGNVDPLDRLAEIAAARGTWFHVDAALGAAALASERHRARFAGIERADSVTIDPHKWFYVPYHCAYLLFRDRIRMDAVELSDPHFVVLRTADPDLGKHSIEGSRAANAIKFWMVAQALGRSGYGALVDQQIEQAAELASLVEGAPDLERLSVPELNILCFRFRMDTHPDVGGREHAGAASPRGSDRLWDEVNVEIHRRLDRGGPVVLSRTMLHRPGSKDPVVALRAVLFHPELGIGDLRRIVDEVSAAGKEILAERGIGGSVSHVCAAPQELSGDRRR